MGKQVLADCHMHTKYSTDGKDAVWELCEAAQRGGLSMIAITDHCDCDFYERDHAAAAIRQSCREAQEAKAQYADRLEVLTGVELGQPLHDLPKAKDALQLANYDFIIGAVHNAQGGPDFYWLDFTAIREKDLVPLFSGYFSELKRLIQWGEFDSLAHLTYPLRYIPKDFPAAMGLAYFFEYIQEILQMLAEAGKALEVNTSGLRQALGETLPGQAVVEQFFRLGGEHVTIGSDAHRAADVGAGVTEGLAVIQKAGFSAYTVYRGRAPQRIPILQGKSLC